MFRKKTVTISLTKANIYIVILFQRKIRQFFISNAYNRRWAWSHLIMWYIVHQSSHFTTINVVNSPVVCQYPAAKCFARFLVFFMSRKVRQWKEFWNLLKLFPINIVQSEKEERSKMTWQELLIRFYLNFMKKS